MTHPFDRLDTGIQRFIWDQDGWTTLRSIQLKAIRSIFDTDHHLLIAAATASGKTEAAFLPVLSKVAQLGDGGGLKALYVGPLKALINDQFRRLELMCEHLEVPVHRWHGDVSSAHKLKLVEAPEGLLLITPESLESLFINRSRHLQRLFGNLGFVVIDEIHAFMGRERGMHLRSLLARIDQIRGKTTRRIGLSATIGEIEQAARWLRFGDVEESDIIEGTEGRELKLLVYGYLQKKSELKTANKPDAQPLLEQRLDDDHDIALDIHRTMRGTTNLVFGNQKSELEVFVDLLNRECRNQRQPQSFLIHHGSLSKSVREDTEHRMQSTEPYTTLCSNTLELGIDVGRIDAIGQLDPPRTVSALVQRMGRSGRSAGAPSVLRFFVREEMPDTLSTPWDRLFLGLLQSVAMVELIIREGWCEPIDDRLHYSTLIQQLLSVLKQTGGIHAGALYDTLFTAGAFDRLAPPDFARLLRHLADQDLIEQIPATDELILGLAGERIVNHYEFYAAFVTKEEFTVIGDGDKIGSVAAMGLTADDHIILAGRRWRVLRVDKERQEVIVTKSAGAQEPDFKSSGWGTVHRKIRQKMREVLRSDSDFSYLDPKAQKMLDYARQTARKFSFDAQPLVRYGQHTLLLPWTGDRQHATLIAMAHALGFRAYDPGGGGQRGVIVVFEGVTPAVVRRILERVAAEEVSGGELARALRREDKEHEKYDGYLPEEFLDRAFIANRLDVEGAREKAAEVLRALPPAALS